MCVGLCAHVCSCLWRPAGGSGSPGVGNHESLAVGLETKPEGHSPVFAISRKLFSGRVDQTAKSGVHRPSKDLNKTHLISKGSTVCASF